MSASDLLEVIAGIRDANFHRGGIKCLRLLELDVAFFADIRTEVDAICAEGGYSDVTDPSHPTNWTVPSGTVRQYSLWNRSGRFEDCSADHDGARRGKGFRHAGLYPALGRLIADLPDLLNCRINLLGPGAALAAHEEHSVTADGTGVAYVKARFHLPVHTAHGAELVLDGDLFELMPGSVYFVNHGCVHSAANRASSARVHLVWDCALTAEAAERLFGTGPYIGLRDVRRVAAEERPVATAGRRPTPVPHRIRPAVSETAAERVSFAPVRG